MANNARDEPSHVSQYSLGLRDIRVRAFHSLATRSEKILNDGFRESTHKSYRLGFDVLRTSDQKVFLFYFILLYTYILLLYIATKFIRFRYYSVFFEYKTFELRDAVPFSLPVLMSFFTPNFFTAVKLWLLIIVVASFTFSIIGFNAAHHHPDIFHDGDIYRFVYIETNFVFSILFDIIFLKKERIVYLASKSKDRPSFFFFFQRRLRLGCVGIGRREGTKGDRRFRFFGTDEFRFARSSSPFTDGRSFLLATLRERF